MVSTNLGSVNSNVAISIRMEPAQWAGTSLAEVAKALHNIRHGKRVPLSALRVLAALRLVSVSRYNVYLTQRASAILGAARQDGLIKCCVCAGRHG